MGFFSECTGVVYESKCYVTSERSPTWFNARAFCVSEGGNLAVSCNADVNDLLADLNTGISCIANELSMMKYPNML